MQELILNKELIPYSFQINFNGKMYLMEINYNLIANYFTINLSLGTKKLVLGEKLVLNEILFRSLYEDSELNLDTNFPNDVIIPLSTNDNIKRLGWDELGNTVFIYTATRKELGIE